MIEHIKFWLARDLVELGFFCLFILIAFIIIMWQDHKKRQEYAKRRREW